MILHYGLYNTVRVFFYFTWLMFHYRKRCFFIQLISVNARKPSRVLFGQVRKIFLALLAFCASSDALSSFSSLRALSTHTSEIKQTQKKEWWSFRYYQYSCNVKKKNVRKWVTCLRGGWSPHPGACGNWSLGQCHCGGAQFETHTPQWSWSTEAWESIESEKKVRQWQRYT